MNELDLLKIGVESILFYQKLDEVAGDVYYDKKRESPRF